MLSQLEIDTENRICIWRIGGETSLEALREGYAARFRHPDWAPDLMSMSVLTRLGLGAFTPDMAVRFAEFVRLCDEQHDRKARRAAIVCGDEMARALLYYWEKKAEDVLGREERTFSSEAEAREWLIGGHTEDAA
ncbi:STAS/SEC14 domain-containing protein [Maricaulis sp.]|uniref:STAS/SEC14 domain-containing protein n=1 Tax=unclassified Maricaulis TaxID=2632371 RepID=UPI001B055749|nr:STAS/SEC14 domain-containing protein [Maricaulis sp.]MBO6796837.1 hypothetical protein [Maricaulis sp.]